MKVMTERTLKRPRCWLQPGRRKLKVAIRYGADAVYIGGMPTVCVAAQEISRKKWRKA